VRRLAPIIYAIVFVDALLLFAIVPLLPDYVVALHSRRHRPAARSGSTAPPPWPWLYLPAGSPTGWGRAGSRLPGWR
jgi:hypothetical protein